ncbi:MAG: transposase [Clostridia bacterium]|nr:transposase [Clostridia bacterium]
MLSDIVGAGVLDCPRVHLKEYGEIVDKQINSLASFYTNIFIDAYVIMPNHVHMLLRIQSDENGQSGTPAPTNRANSVISRFVSKLKRFSNKETGEKIWQRSFHDHVIRGRRDYEEIYSYICQNPLLWERDELYTEE